MAHSAGPHHCVRSFEQRRVQQAACTRGKSGSAQRTCSLSAVCRHQPLGSTTAPALLTADTAVHVRLCTAPVQSIRMNARGGHCVMRGHTASKHWSGACMVVVHMHSASRQASHTSKVSWSLRGLPTCVKQRSRMHVSLRCMSGQHDLSWPVVAAEDPPQSVRLSPQ